MNPPPDGTEYYLNSEGHLECVVITKNGNSVVRGNSAAIGNPAFTKTAWSSDAPTEDGPYWWRRRDGEKPEFARIHTRHPECPTLIDLEGTFEAMTFDELGGGQWQRIPEPRL